MTPLVSVIIPTYGRPQYLRRAVDSALAGMPSGEVEVIIVPNGPDKSWQDSLLTYQDNPTIQIIPIRPANANIARNIGLENASGKYIRFLDDDDYLIPSGAIQQLDIMNARDVDVVSGSIDLIDPQERCFDTWHQPNEQDFCTAVLGPWRKSVISAHLYKYSLIKKLRWRPETTKSQDLEWLFDLCALQEVSWYRTDIIVGVWQHHWGVRISSSMSRNESRKNVMTMLTRTYSSLIQSDRITNEREHAVACGLLWLVHTAFFLEPSFWKDIAKQAKKIYPAARINLPVYDYPIFRQFDLITILWLLLPIRWAFYQVKTIMHHWKLHFTW